MPTQRNIRRLEANNRRRERFGNYGREMEMRVYGLLLRAAGHGLFASVVYNEPSSPKDLDGADFTVSKLIDGQIHEISFGISTSARCCRESKLKHPDKPQLHFPYNIHDERCVERILKLFD